MANFFIRRPSKHFIPSQPPSSYHSGSVTRPRETFELPPILPVSPFPSEPFTPRQESHPGSSTEGLVSSSHIEDTSVLNASGRTLQAHSSRMNQRDAKHSLVLPDRVGATRAKLRPKRPLQIRVLPATQMRSNIDPPSLDSDYSYDLQSDVPTPTAHSQFLYGGSHSQMDPPASPISLSSFFSTTSSLSYSPPSPSLSETERTRSHNTLEKLRRTLGTDVPLAVLLNASLRDGCASDRMTSSRYPQESPLIISSVVDAVGDIGRRPKIGANQTPPIFTAKEAGLANRAEKSCQVGLVDTPESDGSAGGVEMTAREKNGRVERFSKVAKILGETPPDEVYQPISKPRSQQFGVIRDDESFLDFESDSLYASPLSRLSFDLYSESILSLSSGSSEDEEVKTLNGDVKHRDEGSDPLYNPSPCLRSPLPMREGDNRLCDPSPPPCAPPTMDKGNNRLYNPSPLACPPPTIDEGNHHLYNPSPLPCPAPTVDEGNNHLYNPSPRPRPPPRTDDGLDTSLARYPYLRTPSPTSAPVDRSSGSKAVVRFFEDDRFFTSKSSPPEPIASSKVVRSNPKSTEFSSHHRPKSSLLQPPSGRNRISAPSGVDAAPIARPQLQPKGPRATSVPLPSYGHTKKASSSSETLTDARRSGEHSSEFRVRRKRAAKLLKFFGQPVNLTYRDDHDDGEEEDNVGGSEEGGGDITALNRHSKSGMETSPSRFTTTGNKGPPSKPSGYAPCPNPDWMAAWPEVYPFAYSL